MGKIDTKSKTWRAYLLLIYLSSVATILVSFFGLYVMRHPISLTMLTVGGIVPLVIVGLWYVVPVLGEVLEWLARESK